jgi:hypothetical protein
LFEFKFNLSVDIGANMSEVATHEAEVENASYRVFEGVRTSVAAGAARDYATTRASQLIALLDLKRLADDCKHSPVCSETNAGFIWLASGMAEELKELIGIIATDAARIPSQTQQQ